MKAVSSQIFGGWGIRHVLLNINCGKQKIGTVYTKFISLSAYKLHVNIYILDIYQGFDATKVPASSVLSIIDGCTSSSPVPSRNLVWIMSHSL
jgi:hypothetical protein